MLKVFQYTQTMTIFIGEKLVLAKFGLTCRKKKIQENSLNIYSNKKKLIYVHESFLECALVVFFKGCLYFLIWIVRTATTNFYSKKEKSVYFATLIFLL